MYKWLLAFIASILFCQSAIAGDGSTPMLVFRQGHLIGDEIVYCRTGTFPPGDIGFDFVPILNDWHPEHYVLSNGNYQYSAPPPANLPPVLPNCDQFEASIWNDSTIPSAAKLQLALFFPLVERNLLKPAILQAGWKALIDVNAPTTQNQNGWLTQGIQHNVLVYAQSANIQLVATPVVP